MLTGPAPSGVGGCQAAPDAHTGAMTSPRTPTRFVGRTEELGRLREALRAAADGQPVTILLGGDAGVGKTRLVTEFADHARGSGASILWGSCLELGVTGLPYAPVVEALRGSVQELGPSGFRRLAGAGSGELARLIPALARSEDRRGSARSGTHGAGSRLQLFEAVLGFLTRAATDAPCVVVLEDLHWADASTRDLLHFLAHNLQQARVVLVTTYRSDELHRRHPLRALLPRLRREAGVQPLDLPPFDLEELTAFAEAVLGHPAEREQLTSLFERSGGNAFLAGELAAAGAERDHLPEALRELLLLSLDRLPPAAKQVAQVIAAAGGRAGYGLIAAVTGLGEEALAAALRAAEQHGVVVRDGTRADFAFRHALLAEAVVSTLLPGEVTRLHGALARTIERDPALAVRAAAGELAYHWHRARDQPRALLASLAAARDAERELGLLEASGHLERVLELWVQVPEVEVHAGCTHASVLRWAAELADATGRSDRAVALQQAAIAEVEAAAATTATQLGLLHERLGQYHWNTNAEAAALQARSRAVELVPGGPSPERVQVLTAYSHTLALCQRDEDAVVHAQEILVLARALGERASEGAALGTLGTSRAVRGDDHGLDLLQRSRRIADEVDQPEELLRAQHNLAVALLRAGRLVEADRVATEGLERARQLGRERSCMGLACFAAYAQLYLGQWDRAGATLRAIPAGTIGFAGMRHLLDAILEANRGRIVGARRALQAAQGTQTDTYEHSREMYRLAALTVGIHADDRALIEACLVAPRAGADEPAPTALTAAGVLERRALLLRAVADRTDGGGTDTRFADQLREEARELAGQPPPSPWTPVWLALAEAEHRRCTSSSSSSDAAGSWAVVAERCDGFPLPYHAAYARYRWAEALLARGHRAPAEPLVLDAHDAAQRLGATPLQHAVTRLARRANLSMPTADDAVQPAARYGLTPRETEVLALVAEGRTNPEIADEFFISSKTASVHVSNILRKLGVSNRGEAAALAHRLDLVAPAARAASRAAPR